MQELLIVNPSDRAETTRYEENPKRRRRAGRRVTAKQAAWRRTFAKRYGGGRKRRASNPKRRRTSKARRRTGLMASVTRHGHKVSRRSWRASGYRRNPRRRSYRRNPIAIRASMSSIMGTLIQSAQGAAGATLVDMVMGQAVTRGWVPATMLTPNLYPVVKGGVAIGLGLLANMLPLPAVVKRFAVAGVQGSLTCTLRDAVYPYVAGSFPLGGRSHQNMRYSAEDRSGYLGWTGSGRMMAPRRAMGEYLHGSPSAQSTREREAYYPSYGGLGKYMNY